MRRFTLGRRTVLRGMGGAALALPPLEIMNERGARAAGEAIPRRFCMCYGGTSLGAHTVPDLVIPRTTGAAFEKTRGLSPIWGGALPSGESYPSVKADVGVVSGLKVPCNGDATTRNQIPPAGRGPSFHLGAGTMPQLTGWRNGIADVNDPGVFPPTPTASTAEHVVGRAIAGPTPYASLYLRAQARAYYPGSGIQPWSLQDGKLKSPIINLRQAYDTLFSAGGMVNGKTFSVASFIDRRKSILDAVSAKSRRLLPRLGGDDRRRLEQFYQDIRTVETSLELLKMQSGTMSCTPASPPVDPPEGSDIDLVYQKMQYEKNASTQGYASGDQGWSNEELRAQILCDFVHLAFACDLTRSVFLQFTEAQSQMNAYHLTASRQNSRLHDVTHGLGDKDPAAWNADVADIVGWHVKHFCRLAAKLRATDDGAGGRLIDHCAMSMLWEGGYGQIPGDASQPLDAHCTDNMIAVVAGGAGGLKSGQNVFCNNKRHPGEVVLTHMRAVGVPESQPFGELTDAIPGMFDAPS